MNQRTRKLMMDILSLPTAPYHEDAVAGYIVRFAQKRGLPVTEDKYGNLVVRYRNGSRPKPVAITAHMDHPGFEVFEADGCELTAQWLGGCDPKHFPGSKVMVVSDGERIPGRVTSPLSQEERNGRSRTFSIRAQKPLSKQDGVFGYWNLTPVEVKGDLIRTKGADNLASCAAVLAALDRVRQQKAETDLWGVFTRAEEVGLLGAAGIVDARTVPKRVPLVVLETSRELPGAQIGKGAVIRVGDVLSVFDPRVEFAIHTVARGLREKDRRFVFQRQLMSGGTCEASLYTLHGFTVGALAFPLGNYHNQGKRWPAEEYISVTDTDSMIKLCTAIALSPPSGETRTAIKKRFVNSFKSRKQRLLKKP